MVQGLLLRILGPAKGTSSPHGPRRDWMQNTEGLHKPKPPQHSSFCVRVNERLRNGN